MKLFKTGEIISLFLKKNHSMRHFCFLLSILLSFPMLEIQAQQSEIDSLTTLLPSLGENENRVEVLHQLMLSHIRSDKTKAATYGREGLELGKKIGYKLGTATLHKDLGVLHIMSFQYDSTWHYYKLAKEGFASLLNSSNVDQKKAGRKGICRDHRKYRDLVLLSI